MKTIIAIVALFASTAAYADGWVCTSKTGYHRPIRARIYDHTQPAAGTKNVANITLSNTRLSKTAGNRTIASFSDVNGLIANEGSSYEINVDDRYREIKDNKFEDIGGTELGQLKTINIDVDFSYADPIPQGALADGKIVLTKEDGTQIVQKMVCARYLKAN